MDKQQKENIIEVGELNDTVFIRVKGPGNFKNSTPFKEFIHLMIDRGIVDFVLDLDCCTSMDSTFMGVIAGIAVLLKNKENKMITLIKVNDHNLNLLNTLGIDKILSIKIDKGAPNDIALESLEEKRVSKKKLAKNMLEAHATLMSMSEDNRIKFKDVYHFLQKEVDNN